MQIYVLIDVSKPCVYMIRTQYINLIGCSYKCTYRILLICRHLQEKRFWIFPWYCRHVTHVFRRFQLPSSTLWSGHFKNNISHHSVFLQLHLLMMLVAFTKATAMAAMKAADGGGGSSNRESSSIITTSNSVARPVAAVTDIPRYWHKLNRVSFAFINWSLHIRALAHSHTYKHACTLPHSNTYTNAHLRLT